MTRPVGAGGGDTESVKGCCARVYESDLARWLLGESFHPGGLALTDRLATLAEITADSVVLDAASGLGASAIALAERCGCHVLGIDYGRESVGKATEAVAARGLGDRVRFECGDAEALPLADESVDVVICECAFCTFPDKAAAAREFARVLRPGGRVGLSDVTRSAEMPTGELNDLLAWIACLADARPTEGYVEVLNQAGLRVSHVERHDEALQEVVRHVRDRLLAAEILTGLGRLDLPGVDLRAAGRMARAARDAIQAGRLGYAMVVARKAGASRRSEAQPR